MKRYCKFWEDIYDGNILIWKKNEEYLITFEDDSMYKFAEIIVKPSIEYAISKDDEGYKYEVIEKYKREE